MFYSLIPVPICITLIVLYMLARNRNDLKRTAVIQPVLTFLALVNALLSFLSPRQMPAIQPGSWSGWGCASWQTSSISSCPRFGFVV